LTFAAQRGGAPRDFNGYFLLPGLLVKWSADSERKAAGLQQKKVRVEDHEIAYLDGGYGETILMLHGFGANKDNWTRFAKFISPSYHVVALDLPGFGESTCLDDVSYTIANQAWRRLRDTKPATRESGNKSQVRM
jgi:abhydrolase domain-containing protein 6